MGFCRVGNEVSHINSMLHHVCCNYGLVISQFRVLASHTANLGSVAQGAFELYVFQFGSCKFLSDPCLLDISSKKRSL